MYIFIGGVGSRPCGKAFIITWRGGHEDAEFAVGEAFAGARVVDTIAARLE
jgi:hypothetical protein